MVDLRNIVKVAEEGEGVWAPWEEDETVAFKIAYMGRELLRRVRRKSVVKTVNPKTKRIEEDINEDILDKELMASSLVGWRGLKLKHLNSLLDPSVTITFDGDPEAEVPFTPENKEILLNCFNLAFSRFISGVSADAETYRKLREQSLEKN